MINRKQAITYGVLALVSVFVIGNFAIAQGPSLMDRIAQIAGQILGTTLAENLNDPDGEMSLGGSTNGNWNVGGNLAVTGTTSFTGATTFTGAITVQELTLGSRYAVALSPSANATGTPGDLAQLQNTGDTKICNRVELDISSGADGGNTISVTTSTGATVNPVAPSLIGTSTAPTSTAKLFNSVDDPGSSAMNSWTWNAGEYINAQWDLWDDDVTASSGDVINMTGSMYINCHTR